MHTRQLTERWALQMNIQALALADEGTSIRSKIQHRHLWDLPDSFVDSLYVVRYSGDVLDGAVSIMMAYKNESYK